MISALILAAGISSRMGFPKLLLKLGEKTLLRRVVENALASRAGEVVVVLGHKPRLLRAELAPWPQIKVVVNHDYREGMASSLRAGLEALDARAEAALILLADQPLVGAEVLDALMDEFRETGAPIVAPFYGGERGNPVLFARALFPELASVTGDEGGRGVIACHRAEVARVDIPTPSLGWDVDTWEDYLALCATAEAYEGMPTPYAYGMAPERKSEDA